MVSSGCPLHGLSREFSSPLLLPMTSPFIPEFLFIVTLCCWRTHIHRAFSIKGKLAGHGHYPWASTRRYAASYGSAPSWHQCDSHSRTASRERHAPFQSSRDFATFDDSPLLCLAFSLSSPFVLIIVVIYVYTVSGAWDTIV